jgi:hypothetical protein
MNVANSWAFWIGLIGALAVLYVLPTLIGVLAMLRASPWS